MLAVTGSIEFYGQATNNMWTRLLKIAPVGSTNITIASTQDWMIGQAITISATYAGRNETEKVVITAISGNVVSFTPALAFEHYGDTGVTISNQYGVLDTRAAVGMLSRNIVITRGPDANGWGCRILVYSYLEIFTDITIQPKVRTGNAILDAVEISGCGQYDTDYAGLRI